MDLLQFLAKDRPLSFHEHSKKFVRLTETIEKTKRELCLEGVDEVTIDVSDFFDDEDDIELSFDDFADACRETTARFRQQVDAFLAVSSRFCCHVGVTLPIARRRRHRPRWRKYPRSFLLPVARGARDGIRPEIGQGGTHGECRRLCNARNHSRVASPGGETNCGGRGTEKHAISALVVLDGR